MAQRKQEIIVHCEFADNGEEVRDILIEVFHTYISRKIHKNMVF